MGKCLENKFHLINASFGRSYNCLIYVSVTKELNFNFKLNMEQSFKIENTYDIFMNEVRIEDLNLFKNLKKMQMSKHKIPKILKKK